MSVVYAGKSPYKDPETVFRFSQEEVKCESKKCQGKNPSTTFLIDSAMWHLDCYIKEKIGENLNK